MTATLPKLHETSWPKSSYVLEVAENSQIRWLSQWNQLLQQVDPVVRLRHVP